MNAKTAVILTTLYLLVYTILTATGISIIVSCCLFVTSPFVVIWMVYSILRDDRTPYPELGEKVEWGYRDKNTDELGVF